MVIKVKDQMDYMNNGKSMHLKIQTSMRSLTLDVAMDVTTHMYRRFTQQR